MTITTTANTYNHFCYELEAMNIKVHHINHAKCRHWFFNDEGVMIAYLDERKDHGLVFMDKVFGF